MYPARAEYNRLMATIAVANAQLTQASLPYDSQIAVMKMQIQQAVLEIGKTVRGSALMAVYSKGRVTWDTRALDGFAAAYPELLPFRRQGEASVTFREVK